MDETSTPHQVLSKIESLMEAACVIDYSEEFTPSDELVGSILSYSKAHSIRKSSYLNYIEMILN